QTYRSLRAEKLESRGGKQFTLLESAGADVLGGSLTISGISQESLLARVVLDFDLTITEGSDVVGIRREAERIRNLCEEQREDCIARAQLDRLRGAIDDEELNRRIQECNAEYALCTRLANGLARLADLVEKDKGYLDEILPALLEF